MSDIIISVFTPSIRASGLNILQDSLEKQTFPASSFEWLTEIGLRSQGHTLNQAYNRMISRAKGSIFVSIQDYTKVPKDFLERIFEAYKDDTFYTIPLGKTLDWKSVEWDWRKHRTDCTWNEWEIDAGFCPMEALWKIGGFDEELDKRWSFDNQSVGYRAEQFGYKFGAFQGTEAVAFDHDKREKHPFRKDWDPEFWKERLDFYQFNPKLDYLTRESKVIQ